MLFLGARHLESSSRPTPAAAREEGEGAGGREGEARQGEGEVKTGLHLLQPNLTGGSTAQVHTTQAPVQILNTMSPEYL